MKKKSVEKVKGFSIHFIPYSEIRYLDSGKRIKKILGSVLGQNIIILQGKLNPDEETRLIEDTMAMIGHVKNFRGVEIAVISESRNEGIFDKIKRGFIKKLSGADLGAITIIGPATIIKEIKRNPKKIELMLNR